MAESSQRGAGNPRIFDLIADSPKEGKSPTIWSWPQVTEYLKVAAQPVQGPWPPHQDPRPDPDAESGPVAVPDSQGPPAAPAPTPPPASAPAPSDPAPPAPREV